MIRSDSSDDVPIDPHQLTLLQYQDFNKESERLRSFRYHKWPLDSIRPEEMAMLGFFYTGENDTVQCYFCQVKLNNWEPTDSVIAEHLKFSPQCPLLQEAANDNIPIDEVQLNAVLTLWAAQKNDKNNANERLQTSTIQNFNNSNEQDVENSQDIDRRMNFIREVNLSCSFAAGQCSPETGTIGDIQNRKKAVPYEDEADPRLPENDSCKVCFNTKFETVFLPCGHVATCRSCAAHLDKCCICREPIKTYQRLYFS